MVIEKIKGSLLAGAVGDSLGAAVEIFKLEDILAKMGAVGVTTLYPYDPGDYLKWASCEQTGVGVITDDTCMTAAMAAGLMTAHQVKNETGRDLTAHHLHQAFLIWGQHQAWAKGDYKSRFDQTISWPQWFAPFCFSSGAGKNTLAALNGPRIGTLEDPITIASRDGKTKILSEGCGGMMRVAPVAWLHALGMVEDAYDMGCVSAAITHGGPVAQTASGGLAVLIAALLMEQPWEIATQKMLARLKADPRAQQTHRLAIAALKMGDHCGDALNFQDIDDIPRVLNAATFHDKSLFLASAVLVQALVIGAAAQKWPGSDKEKMRRALTLAVTQSGDSDSVGAIVGNVMGAQFGAKALPVDWVSQLQSLHALEAMAQDLEKLSCEKRPGLRPDISAPGVTP